MRATKTRTQSFSVSPGGCVTLLFSSLRGAEGEAAIYLFPMYYEIASVVSLPRNDIMKNSLVGEG